MRFAWHKRWCCRSAVPLSIFQCEIGERGVCFMARSRCGTVCHLPLEYLDRVTNLRSLKLAAPSRSVSPTDAVPPLPHGDDSSRRIVAADNLEHMSRASQFSVAQQIEGGVKPGSRVFLINLC